MKFSQRKGARVLLAALAMLALWSLGACVSTTTETQSVAGPTPDTPPPDDKASIERRAGVRLELASLYFGRGQNETALNEVDKALKVEPDNTQAYNLRGLIYAAMGDVGRAQDSFEQALRLDPHNAGAMQNYGWFLCQNQRYAAAQEQFQRALDEPGYRGTAMTLRAMGNCQARDAKLAEAEASLTRSYELDPSSAATAVNLAEVQYRRGEYEKARFYIDRVNKVPAQVNAQSLWLSVRIESRLGNPKMARAMGDQLVERFAQSPEALAYTQGRLNE